MSIILYKETINDTLKPYKHLFECGGIYFKTSSDNISEVFKWIHNHINNTALNNYVDLIEYDNGRILSKYTYFCMVKSNPSSDKMILRVSSNNPGVMEPIIII